MHFSTGKDRKKLRFRVNLQEKYLTGYYKVLEWTTRNFFTNQLDKSLNKLRAIESLLLYKPTVVHSGGMILELKMALFSYYSPFQCILIWNGKIVEVRTNSYLLIYESIENLLYVRHCIRH